VAHDFAYYGVLYGFPTTLVRVDFILTIAAHIMSGYVHAARSVVGSLPNKDTVFAWNKDTILDLEIGKKTFLTKFDGQPFPVSTYRTVHCMNKDSMLQMADRIIDCYA